MEVNSQGYPGQFNIYVKNQEGCYTKRGRVHGTEATFELTIYEGPSKTFAVKCPVGENEKTLQKYLKALVEMSMGREKVYTKAGLLPKNWKPYLQEKKRTEAKPSGVSLPSLW